jgi:hypothetical protein
MPFSDKPSGGRTQVKFQAYNGQPLPSHRFQPGNKLKFDSL